MSSTPPDLESPPYRFEEISRGRALYCIAVYNTENVRVGQLVINEPNGDVASIAGINVRPEDQRRGLGTQLMDRCIDFCTFRAMSLNIWVDPPNVSGNPSEFYNTYFRKRGIPFHESRSLGHAASVHGAQSEIIVLKEALLHCQYGALFSESKLRPAQFLLSQAPFNRRREEIPPQFSQAHLIALHKGAKLEQIKDLPADIIHFYVNDFLKLEDVARITPLMAVLIKKVDDGYGLPFSEKKADFIKKLLLFGEEIIRAWERKYCLPGGLASYKPYGGDDSDDEFIDSVTIKEQILQQLNQTQQEETRKHDAAVSALVAQRKAEAGRAILSSVGARGEVFADIFKNMLRRIEPVNPETMQFILDQDQDLLTQWIAMHPIPDVDPRSPPPAVPRPRVNIATVKEELLTIKQNRPVDDELPPTMDSSSP